MQLTQLTRGWVQLEFLVRLELRLERLELLLLLRHKQPNQQRLVQHREFRDQPPQQQPQHPMRLVELLLLLLEQRQLQQLAESSLKHRQSLLPAILWVQQLQVCRLHKPVLLGLKQQQPVLLRK